MSDQAPDTRDNDRWHFQDPFRPLVAASSNAVLAARQAEQRASSLNDPQRQSERWAAAVLWSHAARDEVRLARALYQSGRWPDAIQTYLYATQYALSSGDPMQAQGLLLEVERLPGRPLLTEAWAEDERTVREAVSKAAARWHELQVAGHELRRQGHSGADPRIALEMTIAREFPASGHCFYHLAMLHHTANVGARALEMSRYALAFLPDDPRVAILAGHLLLDAGQITESLGVLQRQVRELPGHPSVRVSLALALLRHWDRSRADRGLLVTVLRILPGDELLTAFAPQTRMYAGLLRCVALWHSGRQDEAEDERERLRLSAETENYVPEFLDNPVETWSLVNLVQTSEQELRRAA